VPFRFDPFGLTLAERNAKEALIIQKAMSDWASTQVSYSQEEGGKLYTRITTINVYRCENERIAKGNVTVQIGNMYTFSYACTYGPACGG
jgi:hypothetical protein